MYRYCAAHDNGFALDTSGASNLAELQTLLRQRLMIRRMKTDVLKELPPKIRQYIVLPEEGLDKQILKEISPVRAAVAAYEKQLGIAPLEEEISEDGEEDFLMNRFWDCIKYLGRNDTQSLKQTVEIAFSELAIARKELAMAKLPMAVQYINRLIASSEKVIIFTHHIDVAEALRKNWPECIVVTGRVPTQKRQALIDLFQTDPKRNPIIGNLKAMGVGFALTAATHVVFVEMHPNPSVMEQAEDRPWRIGQLNCVNIHILVVQGSYDARNIHILEDKQEVISAALDTYLSALDTERS